MKHTQEWLIIFGVLLLPGCMGAVRTPPSRIAVQRKAAENHAAPNHHHGAVDNQTQAQTTPTAYQLEGTGPLQELIVKGSPIKADEVWADQQKTLAAQRVKLSPEDFQRYVERESAMLINDRLAEALLHQQASLRMPDEATPRIEGFVDAEIRKIVTTEHGGIQRRYEKALAAEGRTLKQTRDALRRQIVIQSYLEQELRRKVGEPTRRELVETFEQNREAWRRPPQRKMSLIDLRLINYLPKDVTAPSRDQSEAAKSQARSIALEILASLDQGKTFADLAREHSHGLHADEGGAWGWVLPGTVRERFEPAVDALYRLEAGAVAGPIETANGFFIVRCDEADNGFEPDFETMQPQLQEAYGRNRYNRLVTEHVSELRRKSGVDMRTLERFHQAVVQSALEGTPTVD